MHKSGVQPKSFPIARIGASVADIERPLATGPRLNKISPPISNQPERVIGYAGFPKPSRSLSFAQDDQGRSRAERNSPAVAAAAN